MVREWAFSYPSEMGVESNGISFVIHASCFEIRYKRVSFYHIFNEPSLNILRTTVHSGAPHVLREGWARKLQEKAVVRRLAALNFFFFCSIKASENRIVSVAGQIAKSEAEPNDSSPDAGRLSPGFVAKARKETMISSFDIPFPLSSSFVELE